MILPDLFPIITFYSSPGVHDRFGSCVTPVVLVIILKELNEICHLFIITRSYAALRAADLDWIVGLDYSLGGYIFGDSQLQPKTLHTRGHN